MAIFFALTVTPMANAARSEILVSVGMIAPNHSDYRTSAELLGYERRGLRSDLEAEVGYLRALNHWLTVGPLARVYAGRMGAPYEGVAPIDTWGASLAARAEVDLFEWPRIFVWADPSIGLGSIGVPEARKMMWFPGIRGGIGLGMARESKVALRFRIGGAYAPTFSEVTPMAGKFDFGGLVVQLDGAFRVGE